MKLSVAMCTYNGQAYLQEQLDSIQAQSLLPDELIVCDDVSTDQTRQVLQAFAERASFPVRIVQNDTNLGSTRNFVKAIQLCRGDLIALSDQDDVWQREKLATLVQVLQTDRSASAAFSDADLIDAQSRPTGRQLWQVVGFTKSLQALVRQEKTFQVLQQRSFITGATLMLRAETRSLFQDIPPDWIHDAWITWKLAVHGRIVAVPLPLIGYRIHAANQVGVNVHSPMEQVSQRRSDRVSQGLLREAAQLQTLHAHLLHEEAPPGRKAMALEAVEARIGYLQKRATVVGRSRLPRLLPALLLWPRYRKHAKGWRSLLADLAL